MNTPMSKALFAFQKSLVAMAMANYMGEGCMRGLLVVSPCSVYGNTASSLFMSRPRNNKHLHITDMIHFDVILILMIHIMFITMSD